MTLEQYLMLVRREWIPSNTLWSNHRELWAENGDALSKIYAGTGALNTSFTRTGKRTLAGTLPLYDLYPILLNFSHRRFVGRDEERLPSLYQQLPGQGKANCHRHVLGILHFDLHRIDC